MKLLDKYISKQLIETFLLGIFVFTSILFASNAFLTLVKQISTYGISFKVALLIIMLQLPSIMVMTIPMGGLLATITTFNRLNLNNEISVMRACGISIQRMMVPVAIFGITAAILSFSVNEFIVPASSIQARNLTLWAFSQRNIPKGKANFSFRELNSENQLRRLFYIDKCNKNSMSGVTVLDMSKKGAIQIIQSKSGSTDPEYWNFYNGVMYTISGSGKILNTTMFDKLKLYSSFNMFGKHKKKPTSELNFWDLAKYIQSQKTKNVSLIIDLYEKISIPATSLLISLIGVPLAIAPPRSRFSTGGFMFSILVIFCYYLIRAFSISMGEAQIINPLLAAWLPNIVILITGSLLLKKRTA